MKIIAIEAMVRRAGKGGEPFRISPLVDFYNAVSLANIVPAGAYDIDEMEGDLYLRFTKEGDTFLALDSNEEIAVAPGEVCYADGTNVITRHYVYKQAKHAILKSDTKNMILVSEILGELPEDTVQKVADILVKGLEECFGVKTTAVILDKDKTSMY